MLGWDDYLDRCIEEHYAEWEGSTCDKCDKAIDDDEKFSYGYYETPEGNLCWSCAYQLASKLICEQYPDEPDPAVEHEDEVEGLLKDWRI